MRNEFTCRYRFGFIIRECKLLPEYISKQASIIKETEEIARQHLATAQCHQEEHYDLKKAGKPYKKGDLVMLLVKAIPVGEPKKFFKEWSGPCEL